ncbi:MULTISPECIES: HYC_CC_PP family protein [Flavobacterium]|uniref:Secreted protein n=1 Tax=Flavobacterium covae TaxID=2906076 RepID=A0ABW8PH80_9FLAO|nr:MULTISPECIES: hypothetical protein [Flavobacterium]
MKLRRFINICLAFLVLISNTGFAINVHYCGEVVAAVTVEHVEKQSDSDCCENKVQIQDSCCKDKKVEIKKTTSENVLIKSFQLKIPSFVVLESFKLILKRYKVDLIKKDNLLAYYCDTHAPPLYRLYSRLVFYA